MENQFKNLMTIFFDFLISIIFAVVLFILIDYFTLKFSDSNNNSLFTKGISTNIITFSNNYQEILKCRSDNDAGYWVIIDQAFRLFLTPQWGIYDIEMWLKYLEDEQDYAVTIELIGNNLDNSFTNSPRIIISKEFMVNNESDPILICEFIWGQINILYNLFDIDNKENHFLLIHYASLKASN